MTYPYIPAGRKFLFVSEDNLYMREAARARRELSTDRKIPTGSVIVARGKVIGRAGNQARLRNIFLMRLHEKGFCIRRLLHVQTGQKYWLCYGCASSKNHSEPLAVSDALKKTPSIAGGDLYLYGHWWCCKGCWDSMIDAGIKNVYLVEGAKEKFQS
jgi:deoxycytidylate deaminase